MARPRKTDTPAEPAELIEVTDGFAPKGVAYPWAWNALVVLSLANLLVAMVVGLVFGAIGYVNVMRQAPVYQSSAVMLMDQPLALTSGDAGVVVKLNQLRGKYVALILTSEIMTPAASRAKLPVGQVRAAQRPVIPAQTLTLLPTARASSPETAQRIAQATAQTIEDYVADEQAATGLNPAQRISLRIVQNAPLGNKVTPSASRGRQVGVVAGAVGLLVAYVALQLNAASRRDK